MTSWYIRYLYGGIFYTGILVPRGTTCGTTCTTYTVQAVVSVYTGTLPYLLQVIMMLWFKGILYPTLHILVVV